MRRLSVEGALGGALLLATTAALFGSNFVAVKVALRSTDPFTLGVIQAVSAVIVIGGVALRMGGSLTVPRQDAWRLFVPALSMTASQVGFLYGVLNLEAGIASMLASTMPIFSLLLAWLLIRERPTVFGLIGVPIGFIGVAVTASVVAGGSGNEPEGVAAMLVGTFFWALANVLIKRLRPPVSQASLVTWIFACQAVVFVLLAAGVEGLAVDWSWTLGLAAVYSGAVGQGVGSLLLIIVLTHGTAMRSSAVTFLVPIFAVAFGVLFLDEEVFVRQAIGAVLVFSGLVLIVLRGVASQPLETGRTSNRERAS